MGYPTKMVSINAARIRALLKEQGKSMASVATGMGMAPSFLPYAFRRGIMKPRKVEQLAKALNVPLSEITVPEPEPQKEQEAIAPAPPQEAAPAPVGTEELVKLLWAINHNLEGLCKALRPAAVRLTPVEDCVLLLSAMLRYGHCIEDEFKRKAIDLGFDGETIRLAKDIAGVQTKEFGGRKWLARGD